MNLHSILVVFHVINSRITLLNSFKQFVAVLRCFKVVANFVDSLARLDLLSRDSGQSVDVKIGWIVVCRTWETLYVKWIHSWNLTDWFDNKTSTWEEKKFIAWSTGPRKAVRPSAISKIRSNMANTSDDGWWMVQIMVFPLEARFFSVWNEKKSRNYPDLARTSMDLTWTTFCAM